MCGNSGFFHGTILKPYLGAARSTTTNMANIAAGQARNAAAADPLLQSEQNAAIDTALRRRRSRMSSLLAGGSRSVGALSGSALGSAARGPTGGAMSGAGGAGGGSTAGVPQLYRGK